MNQPRLASNFSPAVPSPLRRIEQSEGLALDSALAEANEGAGMILYSDHPHFLHVSSKVVSLSYHSCVHWRSTFNFRQEFSCAFTTWFIGARGLDFGQSCLFNMPSSLSLIMSSFWLEVRNA